MKLNQDQLDMLQVIALSVLISVFLALTILN